MDAEQVKEDLRTGRMTPERLAERDPKGEVLSWFLAIARLSDAAR